MPEHRLSLREKGVHAFVRVLARKACVELTTPDADAFGERDLPGAVHGLLVRAILRFTKPCLSI